MTREEDYMVPTEHAVNHAKRLTTDAEPSTLVGLLARVEAATGPDREIDCLIFGRLDNPTGHWFADERPGAAKIADHIKRYTASVDAALALVERVLPKMAPSLDFDARPRATLYARNVYTIGSQRTAPKAYADAATMPLALLTAMLRALSPPSKIAGEG